MFCIKCYVRGQWSTFKKGLDIVAAKAILFDLSNHNPGIKFRLERIK